MTEQNVSKNGNCYVCGETFGEIAMKNHVLKKHNTGSEESFLLKIESAEFKDYWLYIDIPKSKKLESLDKFLRDIWLECCGHMSRFAASHRSYGNIGKSRTIGSFKAGDKIFYEYDMGTTTPLNIKFIGEIKRPKQSMVVRLLARNIAPVLPCFICDIPAEFVCAECMYDPSESVGAVFCEKHAIKHEHDDMMMPITNSPRSGECGYTGELDTYIFDEKINAVKKNEPKGRRKAPELEVSNSGMITGPLSESMDMLKEIFDFDAPDLTNEDAIEMFGKMRSMFVTPGKPVFTLKEIYAAKTVAALREICEPEEIKRRPRMKKSELIDVIVENHINSDEVKSVFLFLNETEFKLLNDNLDNDFFVADETIFESIIPISARLFVIFESGGEYLCVIPKEMKELYKALADKENFTEIRSKTEKVKSYARAAVNLYGVIEIADFAELYNEYNNTDLDFEMMDAVLTSLGLGGENYGLLENHLVNITLFHSEEVYDIVKYISEFQKNKPRHTPPNEEFLKYADDDYYEKTAEVTAFKEYLSKNGFEDENELNNIFAAIIWSIKNGLNRPLEFMSLLDEMGFHHKSQAAAEKFAEAAMAMHNSIKMWTNNGYSTNEMNNLRR